MMADQGNVAGALHEHALQAEKHLEALATGLAHAGADPTVTKGVTQMADAMRRIVASMGKAQAAQPAPEQQAAPPQQAAPAGGHTMTSAANGLVADVRAKQPQ